MMLKKIYLSFFLLLFLTCRAEAKVETYDQVVGLGYSCQVAWQLEANNLRTLASPFDWFHTPFEGLLLFIYSKGEHFLDLNQIQVLGPYPGDPSKLHVIDLHYNIISYHDFTSTPPLENYNEIKTKYERRTKRFFELLMSKKKVLFVRQESTREQIEFLDYVLHRFYPNLNYTILALNNTDDYKKDWGLERVKNFHIPHQHINWQGDYERWKEVLSQFSVQQTARPASERW